MNNINVLDDLNSTNKTDKSTPKRGRPIKKHEPNTTTMNIALPKQLLEKIDEIRKRISKEQNFGIQFSRASFINQVLAKACTAKEEELDKAKRAKNCH